MTNSNTTESLRFRLPGGFSLPPFGRPQLLSMMVVAIAMWATGALWLGVQAARTWAGSLQPVIHIYLPQKHADRQKGLLSELQRIEPLRNIEMIRDQETLHWLHDWLGNDSGHSKSLLKKLPITLRAHIQGNAPFLIDDLRDVTTRFHAEINPEEFKLVAARTRLTQARNLLLACSFLLMLGLAMIITNTLHLSLLAREDEIGLMRLMGANEWFVRLPFILEGALIGGGAGGVALLLQLPLVLALHTIGIAAGSIMQLILPLLLGGLTIGVLGALLAPHRTTTV
ncbi:MAG: FtsX-like permease family protein [Mariprofundales bacterium]